jgi:hypothetical protein
MRYGIADPYNRRGRGVGNIKEKTGEAKVQRPMTCTLRQEQQNASSWRLDVATVSKRTDVNVCDLRQTINVTGSFSVLYYELNVESEKSGHMLHSQRAMHGRPRNVTDVNCTSSHPYWCFFLQPPWASRLSWDVPADASFLCDKAAVLGSAIKEMLRSA